MRAITDESAYLHGHERVRGDVLRRDPWHYLPRTASFARYGPDHVRLRRLAEEFAHGPVDAYTTFFAAATHVRRLLPRVDYTPDFAGYVLAVKFEELRLATSPSRSGAEHRAVLERLPLTCDGLVVPFSGPGDRIRLAARPQIVELVRELRVQVVFPDRSVRVAA